MLFKKNDVVHCSQRICAANSSASAFDNLSAVVVVCAAIVSLRMRPKLIRNCQAHKVQRPTDRSGSVLRQSSRKWSLQYSVCCCGAISDR